LNSTELLNNKIDKSFYLQSVTDAARNLLGKYLVKFEKSEILAGKIVETEAYDYKFDEASHSFKGKTKKNEVMFEEGGKLYIYFTYGMYFCANVVTGRKDYGSAVLIRAAEPLQGIEKMFKRRFPEIIFSEKDKTKICSGPGKLCIAFALDKESNGTDLCGNNIFISEGEYIEPAKIKSGKRIGIKKSQDLNWRYYIENNPYISVK